MTFSISYLISNEQYRIMSILQNEVNKSSNFRDLYEPKWAKTDSVTCCIYCRRLPAIPRHYFESANLEYIFFLKAIDFFMIAR